MKLYAIAADTLLIFHVSFVMFVVAGLAAVIVGGLRHWSWVRNPWFRLAHLAAIVVVVLQSWAGHICPLTTWEMALRVRAGQESYQDSFVSYWLQRVLYYDAPAWAFIVCYTVFGALVLAVWYWVRPRPWRRQ
jgi:carbon starvation protein CstA